MTVRTETYCYIVVIQVFRIFRILSMHLWWKVGTKAIKHNPTGIEHATVLKFKWIVVLVSSSLAVSHYTLGVFVLGNCYPELL